MAAIAVSLGSMIVGFSSGYTSPALPSMKEPLNATNATAFPMTTGEVSVFFLSNNPHTTINNFFFNRKHGLVVLCHWLHYLVVLLVVH